MKQPIHCSFLLGVVLAWMPTIVLAQSNNGNASMPQHDPSPSTNSSMKSGNNQTSGGMAANDKKFMRETAEGGLAEVELGKLATEKASSPEVKKFGQRMVDDHSKANEELKQVASSKGVDLPDKLTGKDKLLKERLSKLSGPQFDRAYMENMVKDHKKDVADFNRESASAKDSEVKQFASKTLPTLKDHLKAAEAIAPSGKTASAGAPTQ